jgi:hypothetical protein
MLFRYRVQFWLHAPILLFTTADFSYLFFKQNVPSLKYLEIHFRLVLLSSLVLTTINMY